MHVDTDDDSRDGAPDQRKLTRGAHCDKKDKKIGDDARGLAMKRAQPRKRTADRHGFRDPGRPAARHVDVESQYLRSNMPGRSSLN
jgi:hypothetical protein